MGAAVGAFAGIARTQLQCQRRTPQSAAGGLRSGGLVARKSVQCPVRDILARRSNRFRDREYAGHGQRPWNRD